MSLLSPPIQVSSLIFSEFVLLPTKFFKNVKLRSIMMWGSFIDGSTDMSELCGLEGTIRLNYIL